MKNVFLVGVAMLSILVVSMVPQAFSFCIPPNPASDDGKYEIFGPHVSGIKIFVYATQSDMFTGMDTGQMDLEDVAIDSAHVASWSTANGPITLQNYGGDTSYYLIDINNNATYTPADNVSGTYNPTSNLALRQAIAACVNRSCIESFTGGFALPIYTPVPTYMSGYVNSQIAPGQSLEALTYGGYTGNLTLANQILDANGFPWNGNHTIRLDTHNGNVTLNLIFYSRNFDRQILGDHLNAALNTVGIGTTYYSGMPRANVTGPVFTQEYFNLYTGGWSNIGPDPDYLCDLYNGSNYYHPGYLPPNYDGINYPETNQNATTIKLAPDVATATQATKDFQYWFAYYAAAVPVFSYTGIKGYKNVPKETSTSMTPVTYPPTGDWAHVVNQKGVGANSWWSKLDMQTYGYLYPGMNCTYGFSSTVTLQNIVYSQSYWDLEVLNAIYDVGWARDPHTLQWAVPQLYENYTIGNWTDPITSETKTSVTVTLRPDVFWQDGQPVTIADVYYTFVEISRDLLAKGFPPPWWYYTVQNMRSVEILDDYNIEVLLDVYSLWAAGWVIGDVIIPKHIWKPIVDASINDGVHNYVQGVTPDPNIIGSGPFRWDSGTGGNVSDTIVMMANSPGSVVHNITSPGYYLYYPVMATVNTPNYATKINVAGQTPTSVPVTLTLRNLWTDGSLGVNKYVYVNGVLQPGYPVSKTLAPVSPYPLGTSDVETLNLSLAVPSLTYVKLAVRITGPNPLNYTEAWNTTTVSYSVSNPWLSQWINVTLPIWVNMYADEMSVSPSIMSPTNDQTIGSRFNVTVSLSMAENVFAWQTAMHYNRTQLMCTRAAVTSYPSSQYMIGHQTIMGATIDSGVYGNGSVLVAEHCVGNDSVSGSHEGTLFWAEFQILQTPGTNQSLNSVFDISSEYASGGTFVMGSSLNELAFTQSDGVYDFVGPIVISTPTGSNVTVTPAQNVNITFADVTTAGSTTVSSVQPPTSQFVSVACNQITTNASYTGNITLEFGYDPSGLSLQDQQAMKIWLWNDSASTWVDVTTYVNTTSHVVYGISPHLSMFGVTSNLGITGDMDVQGTTIVSIPSTPPAPPHGLACLNYYQINTTKSLTPPINLSLAYNYGNIPPEEQIFTQMWMWNESSASWVDITTGVNTAGHTVYGSAPHLSMFGVTCLPPSPYAVAILGANLPKTVVCQGFSANMSFSILNNGTPQTEFDVPLFWNTTLLTTYHLDNLNPNSQVILNFTWNTTGLAKGNYSISTYFDHIGWVCVSMVGDLTGNTPGVPDGKCDIRDIALVAKGFGSTPGTPGWNANCDVNNDGIINIKDIAIVAKHFGQSDP